MKKSKARMIHVAMIGMLVALHVLLSRFGSINAWNLKIGFTFVPVFASAYFFGPLPAALVGGLGDFLGAILFPIGPYFPGFTLNCALTGIIFGVLLHQKPGLCLHQRHGLPRVMAATILNQFILSLFGTSFWISLLYGSPYWAVVVSRIFQAVILSILEVVVILTLSKAFFVQGRFILPHGGMSHDS